MPPRLIRLAVTLGLVAAAGAAAAQPSSCAEALQTAERQYRDQVYSAVEPTLRACRLPSPAPRFQLVQAYRLVALASIKQGLVDAARAAVWQLLQADPTYRADPLADLPVYVDVVEAVRREHAASGRVDGPAPAPPGAPDTGGPDAAPVDLNTASAEALEAVPGIGPALAARIVAYRAETGPFATVDELEAVRGIGPRTIERMRPYLTVSNRRVVRTVVGGGVPAAGAPAERGAPRGRVDLNAATAAELEALDGIGPVLAGRILAFRAENGPFRTVADLLNVRGIGPRTLERLRPQLAVE